MYMQIILLVLAGTLIGTLLGMNLAIKKMLSIQDKPKEKTAPPRTIIDMMSVGETAIFDVDKKQYAHVRNYVYSIQKRSRRKFKTSFSGVARTFAVTRTS